MAVAAAVAEAAEAAEAEAVSLSRESSVAAQAKSVHYAYLETEVREQEVRGAEVPRPEEAGLHAAADAVGAT